MNLPPLLSEGFPPRHSDHTSFTKRFDSRKIADLIVYVIDIVPSGDGIVEITRPKKKMGDELEIKDLGNLK